MSLEDLILVFDIGTTALKSALFSPSGEELASTTSPYPTSYPKPGWAEQDARGYWTAACEATRKLAEGVDLGRVAAIGLSGHMNGCLAVDDQGTPLAPLIIHSDVRGTEEKKAILRVIPEEDFYRLTGNRPDEHLSLPKILWVAQKRPDIYSSTAYFLNSKDYLRFRLTGVLGETDFSDASLTCAMDIQGRSWASELLGELALDPGRFPHIRASDEEAGRLTTEAAEALGLTSGIPVSVGGGDGACATRGAGVVDGRDAYACIGSSAWISTLAEHPIYDRAMRIQNYYDLGGHRCNVCGTVQSAGAAIDWALDLVLGPGPRDFPSLEERLRKVPAGSDGVLFAPYLMGERTPHWDPVARGSFVGFSLKHGSDALLRSVFEGVAFALKDVLSVYEDLGLHPTELTLLGGAARSDLWRGIMRNQWGLPVRPHGAPASATALGAAMAAGIMVGMWSSYDEACALVQKGKEIPEDREDSQVYQTLYPIYKELYRALSPLYHRIAELEGQKA